MLSNSKFRFFDDEDGQPTTEQFFSAEDIHRVASNVNNTTPKSSNSSLLSDQISSIYSHDSGSIKKIKFRFGSEDKFTSVASIDGDHDSGVDESTQGQLSAEVSESLSRLDSLPELVLKLPLRLSSPLRLKKKEPQTNGEIGSPKKSLESRKIQGSPTKLPKVAARIPKETPPATGSSTTSEKKKVPMNKVQVGMAASPNLKSVRSKIGSLENSTYRPGGGNVKIENKKLDFSTKAQSRVAAKNDKYAPKGGEKKILTQKLNWSAKSKIGSLDNATHKPGGGDKKIETVKVDFKDKAKSKVGSRDNIKHSPGGGTIKIETKKLEFSEKAASKVGSLDNMTHKPGGGEKRIFDDKDYLKQVGSRTSSRASSECLASGTQSPVPSLTPNPPEEEEEETAQS